MPHNYFHSIGDILFNASSFIIMNKYIGFLISQPKETSQYIVSYKEIRSWGAFSVVPSQPKTQKHTITR